MKKIKKRCLRIILNDYESNHETLLRKSKKPTMEIRRLRILPVEKNICTPKENSKVRQNDIIVKRINTSRLGTQSLRSKNMEQPATKYKIRNIVSDI